MSTFAFRDTFYHLRDWEPKDAALLFEAYATSHAANMLSAIPIDEAPKKSLLDLQFRAQETSYRQILSRCKFLDD